MMNVKLSKGKYISSVINQENFVCVCVIKDQQKPWPVSDTENWNKTLNEGTPTESINKN